VNQTRLHCVNQMGKTHSKPLAARHGRETAWERHAMCESALTKCSSYFALDSFNKCHGNRINQATTTSSRVLDAYRSSVNLTNNFVSNIKCRDYCPMKRKNNPDFNKYFLSFETYCRNTEL
jgi:hypothetical protein